MEEGVVDYMLECGLVDCWFWDGWFERKLWCSLSKKKKENQSPSDTLGVVLLLLMRKATVT